MTELCVPVIHPAYLNHVHGNTKYFINVLPTLFQAPPVDNDISTAIKEIVNHKTKCIFGRFSVH